ncbi:MAG: endonuclease MutS2 [Spirochaetaceae bacterium]|nr:MAG: endonuclease MutS2 [Spirochaetaceae bacterium]
MSKHSPKPFLDPHTLNLLDFSSIRRALQERCFSEAGRQALEDQTISTDSVEVEERKAEAVAFRRMLESGKPFPDLDFPDIRSLEPKLFKRGVLFELEELFALGRFIVSGRRLAKAVEASAEELLLPLAAAMPDAKALSKEIFSIVDREGNLRENHIPVLKEIRSRIRTLEREVDKTARTYLHDPTYQSLWQANQPAEKNGRIVLPIKSNFKGRIPGIVHDVSASGSTVYLEPAEIVAKNNAIVEEQNRYRREVHRILRELSTKVVAQSAEIQDLFESVARLDTLQARARFAIHHRCAPTVLSDRVLKLYEARHPLLGQICVPISVILGGEYRVLIVTGPNTGGKTVTLKTIGLLAAMNQFGMEIPAREDSTLPVFDTILADIGDEQSIEQSLSTFSAHIVNISRIIRSSTSASLVLFDELGAGTDPEEGVAIAMGLLDHFIEKGCLCMATTHHGILKNYGYSREGVENAAMEFDVQNLRPTFRIILGVPGESHALEIARRTGIPGEILESAGQYLREERGDVAELINRLSERQRKLLVTEEQQQSREAELREKTRRTDLKELHLRQKELELREQGIAELKRFLKDSRSRFEGLVAELQSAGDRQERKQAGAFLNELAEHVQKQEQALEEERAELYQAPQLGLQLGAEVLIRGTGKRGILVKRAKGDRWIVVTDTLRGTFPAGDLQPLERDTKDAGADEPLLSVSEELQSPPPAFQIDLRGLRLEDALKQVELQIDRALVSGMSEFSIVHGMGEGILQRGIHEYLKHSSHVKEYFFSTPEQGGFGRTVVRL